MSLRNFRRASRPQGLPAMTGFAVLAGSCTALFGPIAPGAAQLACCVAAGACAFALRRPLALAFCLGLLLTLLACRAELAMRWPADESGVRVVAQVKVESIPVERAGVLQFDGSVRVEAPQRLARTLRARVHWRGATPGGPRAGETWRLLMRLDTVQSRRNPGAADRERLLFRDRIHAMAAVLPSPMNRAVQRERPSLPGLRAGIADLIRDVVTDRDAAALVAGLAVGVTGQISREQWRVFGATGTTHLVAISGLHVTMFAWLAAALARRSWRLGGRVALRVDREPFALLVGVLCAAGYAVLAGFGVPTQRTLAMLAVWSAFRVMGREQDGARVLGMALLAVLALDPLAPLSSGLWLSFGAMGMLLAGESLAAAARTRATAAPGVRAWRWLSAAIAEQWRVTVALAPATLLLFSSVPLAGLAVNLVAIPVFSFVLVPLVLGSLAVLPLHPPLGWAGWRAAESIYLAGWPWLQAAADWSWAQLQAAPGALAIGALVFAVPWLLLPAPPSLRAGAALALLTLVAEPEVPVAPGEAQVTVLDAGDGIAVLVRTRHHALLYETGAVYGAGASRIESLVLPALRAAGIRSLDMLVLAASTAHRAEGAGALLASWPVAAARVGGRWPGAPPPLAECDAREGWYWDGVEFEVRPAVAWTGDAATRAPGGPSCVLRVRAHGGDALLLASQLDAAEAAALAAEPARVRAAVVLAPRRGSPSVMNAALAAAVAPRWVVVGGSPPAAARRESIARAWRVGAGRVLSPADAGALAFTLRGDGVVRPQPPGAGAWPWIWRTAIPPARL
jgi:competence protein ComEC